MSKVMQPYRIVFAAEQDTREFPAIERSSGELFRAVPSLAWIADDTVMSSAEHNRCFKNGLVSAAKDERGSSVGFLTAEIFDMHLHILQIAVMHGAQRRGIGKRLIEFAVSYGATRGLCAVTLTTFRNIPWNRPFYEQAGFRVIEPCRLDRRLRSILETEAARGLPADERCAMIRFIEP
jgi:GNAT superfamily N-acetyltransferase